MPGDRLRNELGTGSRRTGLLLPSDGRAQEGTGFVYAYRAQTDRYALVGPLATAEQVDVARDLINVPGSPTNDLRALADLVGDQGPLTVRHAQLLLVHCIDRELAARNRFASSRADRDTRLERARQVVLSGSIRRAAEALLLDTISSVALSSEPIGIAYHVAGPAGFGGRVHADGVESAADMAVHLDHLALRHDVRIHTSAVTHGLGAVPIAARELVPSHIPKTRLRSN